MRLRDSRQVLIPSANLSLIDFAQAELADVRGQVQKRAHTNDVEEEGDDGARASAMPNKRMKVIEEEQIEVVTLLDD